jgi:hypothetical protein
MSTEISNYTIVFFVIIIIYLLNTNNRFQHNRLTHDIQPCDGFIGYSTYDGITKIELSNRPLPYIRFNKDNNTILVPNSNDAYLRLFDKPLINCNEFNKL